MQFELLLPSGNMMRLLELADQHRKEANKLLNPKTKSALGQFMTPAPICLFMASLFDDIKVTSSYSIQAAEWGRSLRRL